ncbi:hypothetical protein R3Q08_30745 [Rhodococcus erythropolis]|uniref:hypothetical protein n=1 Tax=Rhodococcus erythropolis TaxID=1833 RepID=UPI0029496E8C|nr:hypothetical protein [Rhodococcus erythropolis]MDV6212644.1 hypothetical protein [Rhodococcus erythropolis]
MPLTKKFSEMYDDALVALAAASQRPATVVNMDGYYAIRVDLEYSRYVVATNSPRGLWDEPDVSGSWLARIPHTGERLPHSEALSEGILDQGVVAHSELG